MKIKNPETGEVIVIPQGMEDAVRDAIESGNDPMEAMQMKYGGIHINPANKGKFNATKKATGKTTEELTHSKNPLTRKRAIFAQNASRWKHQDGGQAMQQQQQQQPQGGGQEDQMQQLVQMAEQALAQGASPEEVAQMLIQQGVPEQVVQQVIQYAIQDLQQQQQAQGQNPEEQMQQQNPQEEQTEMGYGGYMQNGGDGLSEKAIMALQNPNIRSQPYINGAYETFMKTGDTNALNDYNAYTEANKYLLQRDSVQNANNTDYYPYGNAPKQRFIQKGYGGMSMYGNGGQLPESLLRTRMKASGASPEEINNYLIENYNYGGMTMYGSGGMIKRADGSYSKRGLWDNIRANKGSGKAPTKEMLEQESKIRAREAAYGGAYGNGGGIDNPGFRALPDYVQQDIIDNMQTGGRFLRKAQFGVYDDNSSYRDNPNDPNSAAYNNFTATNAGQPRQYQEEVQMDKMPAYNQNQSTGYNLYGYDKANPLPSSMDKINPMYPIQYHGKNYDSDYPSKINNKDLYNYSGYNVGGSGYFNRGVNHLNNAANYFVQGSQNKRYGGLHRMDIGGLNLNNTNSNATWGQGLGTGTSFTSPPSTPQINSYPNFVTDPYQTQDLPLDNTVLAQNEAPSQQLRGINKWASGIGKAFSNNNVDYGKAALETTKGIEDLSKGTVEVFGNNISNRNALQDEANNLRSSMRAGYQKVGKRPTDGNAIISKYGGKMMQDGGATYADKMKVSKNSPEADFIAEKGEYIVNNGIASKLETGGSHASGNDTAISLDKSSNPSYVLSDTPRLKQLQFGGKRVSPSKYAEMATVEALGKTPDQILKGYTAFTKRAGTEGKVFGDRISDATNQLLAQKYQKDLATVKQIADQAYHKQEQLKYAMGMDNDLDHAQEVNGMSMAKSGGMQDGVHMNYFNAPAVQYGGSPQLFSDPSELGYNTTQMGYGGMPMAYGGLPKMQAAGKVLNTTRQQSPIDYTKDYGIKLNTSDVRMDEYADMQNKSKIGFGNAEENLQSFSKWKGIYPGYDELMIEINKPGGPGKGNPKVGNFQKWINNDYIPQQVEKLNTERIAAGQPAYDATQLGQLKTDLIKDFGFDDTTGQRIDSDFGAFTSSRTPINFSFNKKKEEKKKKEDEVITGDETETANSNIEKGKERPTYDIPPANFYIPQSYGRNPIGLALAQPQTIRPAKLNIQPELNEYNRGIRGAFRGTQGNTSVDVAQQMQGLNNLYGAQNKLYGQKYNFDEQSRMGAEQFNAQALMNTDAGNLQRIGAQQDAIARREGILDTQRRTDFQAGIENADKQNAYGLSKEFINKNFSPLSNSGNMYIYDPSRVTPVEKEKSYTKSQWEKITADEKRAAEKNATKPSKYGGSVKKIKLKLRK